MPAININIYLPELHTVLFNTVNDVNTATPVPQVPGTGKPVNINLSDNVYYLNNDNTNINGWLYIMQPDDIDRTQMWIHDDNSNTWRQFMAYSDCIESVGTVTDNNSSVYNAYRYGYYDEDLEQWINTSRNLSFNLV